MAEPKMVRDIETSGGVTELGAPAAHLTVAVQEGSTFVEVILNGEVAYLNFAQAGALMLAIGAAGVDL